MFDVCSMQPCHEPPPDGQTLGDDPYTCEMKN